MTILTSTTKWQHLEPRPSSWRKQLYMKGRKLTAFNVWLDMIVNEISPEEVADSKDLLIAAVKEAIRELLEQEAKAEDSKTIFLLIQALLNLLQLS